MNHGMKLVTFSTAYSSLHVCNHKSNFMYKKVKHDWVCQKWRVPRLVAIHFKFLKHNTLRKKCGMLRCFEKNEWDEIPTANQTRQCQITNLYMFFPLNCQFIVDFRLPQYGPAIKGGHITCCLLPQGQFFFYFQSCHVSQSDVTSTDDQEGISVPAATGAFWHFKESSP